MRYVIIGCGSVGTGLAQRLSGAGHDVTVVDREQHSFDRLRRLPKTRTLRGSGTNRKVLLAAGIENADGLAAVTSSDEVNIVVGRIAREVFHVPKVVARLYEPRKAVVYAALGLETLSPVIWGVNRMADLLVYSELHSVAALGSGEVDIVEVEVPGHIAGRTAADLYVPGEVQVVAITRRGTTFLPAPDQRIEGGDVLHLTVLSAKAARLKSLLSASGGA